MRQPISIAVLLLALVAVAAPSPTRAQGATGEIAPDVRDVAPYMMIIVDSSGSMERLPGCLCTTAACNECLQGGGQTAPASVACGDPTLAPAANRWAVTLAALTGDFVNYKCESVPRTDSNVFSYDLGYYIPYHQPWACTTPGTACPYFDATSSCAVDANCTNTQYPFCIGGKCQALKQQPNGILDQYAAQVQFGLMTFDGWDTYVGYPPLVAASEFRGMPTTAGPDLSESKSGLWSYGGGKEFHYPNCTVDYMMDTGARSVEADEGRLISINSCSGVPTCPAWCVAAGGCDPYPENIRGQINTSIQDTLLRARPYGGTPIAGVLDDLYHHFKNDMNDGFESCRGHFALLITDGYPDDDYRSYGCDCQSTDPAGANFCNAGRGPCPDAASCTNDQSYMKCPYRMSEEIACDLVNGRSCAKCDLNPGPCKITAPDTAAPMERLFVVGLDVADEAAKTTLNDIAYWGSVDHKKVDATNYAFFADSTNLPLLKQQLGTIIDETIKPLSRAVPAFVTGSGRDDAKGTANQYQISTGFEHTVTGLWHGLIERRRFVCGGTSGVEAPDLDGSKGDLFHERLDGQTSVNGQIARNLLSVQPPTAGADLQHRLYKDASNPCGTSGCSIVHLDDGSIDTVALGLGAVNAQTTQKQTDIMKWMYGRSGSVRFPPVGKRLGDIRHSLPVVIGPPPVASGDEAYDLWRVRTGIRDRPLTLYVGSNDGIVSAFAVEPWPLASATPTYKAGEEIFGFVPPLLLDDLEDNVAWNANGSVVSRHQFTMDGTAVVKDVYFTNWNASANRVLTAAEKADQYHTVLVTGMRNGGKSYVALDVTDPTNPKFLWQYNDDATMGFTFAQPAVVQAVYTRGTHQEQRAVAILPGGVGTVGHSDVPANDCANGVTNPQMLNTNGSVSGRFSTLNTLPTGPTVAEHRHRADIRCWNKVGRSLHFVDVATGELIKKIYLSSSSTRPLVFTSPLVGTPTVFQDRIGTLASRGFLVDADGVIWRIDMSDPTQTKGDEGPYDPSAPTGWSVRPFHDIFWDKGPKDGELSYEAPILSVDPSGNLVVLAGTGDTNNFLKLAVENRVVSLTEVVDPNMATSTSAARWKAAFNWEKRIQPSSGAQGTTSLVTSELVTGPMALSEGQLFFGTFIALNESGGSCDLGRGRLFAVDYREIARDANGNPSDPNGTTPPTYGPKLLSGFPSLFNVGDKAAEDNFFVMGLALTTRPSCTIVQNPEDLFDIWGERMSYLTPGPGGQAGATYLVAHGSGDNPIEVHAKSRFGSAELQLQRQARRTQILSWAASVD